MTLSDPQPVFQRHGILTGRISRRRCESFQLYKAQFQITRGSTENVLKKTWGLSLNFFAKSDARCFTPVMEIMPKLTELIVVVTATQTYSLSEECFGYNCGRLKSSASHASRENTLL